MRGKHKPQFPYITYEGITPAGAGKTELEWAAQMGTADHPRRCGENFTFSWYTVKEKGSPPQVRGKPGKIMQLSALVRITPAGAGKTIIAILRILFGAGSPPQVRGKPSFPYLNLRITRITPAGAGKTANP